MRTICALVFIVTLLSPNVFAANPASQPPAVNPHPPTRKIDKERVAFAIKEIKKKYGNEIEIRYAHLIPGIADTFEQRQRELSQGGQLSPQESSRVTSSPSMPEITLKSDEYIVHAYMRYPRTGVWYHVNVVMTEGGGEKFVVRGVYNRPLPTSREKDC